MRQLIPALIVFAIAAPARAQDASRTRIIAALEQLMVTGEPRHTTHDEGEWLQAEVNLAVARQDAEIVRLAQRAASPILVGVSTPVSPTTEPVVLTVLSRPVLSLNPEVGYKAEIRVAADDGDWISIGTIASNQETGLSRLPAAAVNSGVHRLRVSARVTYEGASGLAPEERSLADVFYARFDPQVNIRADARLYITSAIDTLARRIDGSLPDLPFGLWLHTLVLSHGGQFDESYWRTSFCEERVAEAGVRPQGRTVCALIDFMVGGAIGRLWVRTGRIEVTGGEVRWLVEAPEFEGMLMGGMEFQSIASLPDLLTMPRESWPSGDVVVAPEDMSVAASATSVRVTATIKNIGPEPLYGVYVAFAISRGDDRGARRSLVLNLPANFSKRIVLDLPLMTRYATVVVQALQLGEHAPFDSWTPDPTPENSVAFRIVKPSAAPRGYADLVRATCGGACRGF